MFRHVNPMILIRPLPGANVPLGINPATAPATIAQLEAVDACLCPGSGPGHAILVLVPSTLALRPNTCGCRKLYHILFIVLRQNLGALPT